MRKGLKIAEAVGVRLKLLCFHGILDFLINTPCVKQMALFESGPPQWGRVIEGGCRRLGGHQGIRSKYRVTIQCYRNRI